LTEINYPINFKVTAYSKLKKDSEDEILVNKIESSKKIYNIGNLNLINLIKVSNFENVDINDKNNSNKILLDSFCDGIGKFDHFSNFIKARIFFVLIKQLKNINYNLTLENYKEESNKCIFIFFILYIDLESVKNLTIYLIKEDPKLRIKDNLEILSTDMIIENDKTFILKVGKLKIDEFKDIEMNQNNNLKVDLKNTFDPYR